MKTNSRTDKQIKYVYCDQTHAITEKKITEIISVIAHTQNCARNSNII